MSTPRSRLAGFGASLLIVLFVLGTPALLLAIGATPWQEDLSTLRNLLTSPDDGTLALLVIGVVAWIAWAVMTILFVLEVMAVVRGVPAPRLPGLGLPQHFAGRLVAVAALLFVVAPTVTPVFAPPPAHSAAASESTPTLIQTDAEPETSVEPSPALAAASGPEATAFDYTVRRGDSLWKIAERFLGDGKRFNELHQLNRDVLGDDPGFIHSGTIIRIPVEGLRHLSPTDSVHIVSRGEWLSTIAADKLGDASRFKEIFEASKDIIQPDGDRLTDPNLIKPGWILTIPGQERAPEADIPTEHEEAPPSLPDDGAEPEPVEPEQPAPEASTDPPPSTDHDPQPDENDAAEADGIPGWLLPGLSGAGVILAAGLLAAIRRHQRTQLRHRRPGHVVTPPPRTLAAAEKSARANGPAVRGSIDQLDRHLRAIAATGKMPGLVAVELAEDRATLHLTPGSEETQLPEPWTGTELVRSVPLHSNVAEVQNDRPAPYPLLTTVGRHNDGTLWLLHLGNFAHVSVTGDPDRGEDLLRHLAAELALNPWSAEVDIDTFGLTANLVDLDPVRLHHHEDTDVLDRLVADLGRPVAATLEPERQRALLLGRAHSSASASRAFTLATETHRSRGLTVVALGGDSGPDALVVEVDDAGELNIPRLGVALEAAGLSEAEAASCAAIVDVTREAQVELVPVEISADGREGLVDKAGALRAELVEQRPMTAAGSASLLPRSTSDYAEVTATTNEDVELLAPGVPEQTRVLVERNDPNLDQDVACWFDPQCPLPRVNVLGPVRGRAHGDAKTVAKRKPFYTELLAYLALHPDGVTSNQIADAFSITPPRARVDVNAVRSWLGTNPRTGAAHLPAAGRIPRGSATRRASLPSRRRAARRRPVPPATSTRSSARSGRHHRPCGRATAGHGPTVRPTAARWLGLAPGR